MYGFWADVLADPWLVLMLLAAAGLGNLWRRRVESRRRLWLITAPFLVLVIICTPVVAHLAVLSLCWGLGPASPRPEQLPALVVLGGYVMPPTESRPAARLGCDSLNRCLRAAELYRQGPPCLVVITGGKMDPEQPGPAISEAMGEFLVRWGLPEQDLLLDTQSRSTYENAVQARRLLEPRGVRQIFLVTDPIHLRRAELCFRRQGFDVLHAGCAEEADDFEWNYRSFLPQLDSAGQMGQVAHEWLGLLYYRLAGRI